MALIIRWQFTNLDCSLVEWSTHGKEATTSYYANYLLLLKDAPQLIWKLYNQQFVLFKSSNKQFTMRYIFKVAMAVSDLKMPNLPNDLLYVCHDLQPSYCPRKIFLWSRTKWVGNYQKNKLVWIISQWTCQLVHFCFDSWQLITTCRFYYNRVVSSVHISVNQPLR